MDIDVVVVFVVFAILGGWLVLRIFSRPAKVRPSRQIAAPQRQDETSSPPTGALEVLAEVVRTGDFVTLDLETTGLGEDAEIIEIAIVDSDGLVLIDQRVRPQQAPERSAIDKHGLTASMLKKYPRWTEIEPLVRQTLSGRSVIAFNAEFEQRLLDQTSRRWKTPPIRMHPYCAMLAYAELRGKWDRKKGDYRWIGLEDACLREGISTENSHSALADTIRLLQLLPVLQKGSASISNNALLHSLRAASKTGEVLSVVYNGGTQPGTRRALQVLSVTPTHARAQCLVSGMLKTYRLDRISIVGADHAAPQYQS